MTLTRGEDVDFEMGVLTREGGGGGSGKRRDCPLGHLVRAGWSSTEKLNLLNQPPLLQFLE